MLSVGGDKRRECRQQENLIKVMETSMYEDGYNNLGGLGKESVSQMKRRLTLDLNTRPAKKQRAQTSFNPLLTSPDLNQLKLASPELERLIIQQSMGPAAPTAPSHQFFFSKTATVEAEEFAKGFQDQLEQLHHQNAITAAGGVVAVSEAGLQYTQLEAPGAAPVPHCPPGEVAIKEEPQCVPGASPPHSPIDMESQERIKLERKRLRNRIAASKCRKRKLERIGRLEHKVRELKTENVELQAVVNRLREQVCSLKQEVMDHVSSGCQIPFITSQ